MYKGAEKVRNVMGLSNSKIEYKQMLTKCQRCGSTRVLECLAHAGDCQNYTLNNKEIVDSYYAPEIEDICMGDDLFPDICLDCGQTQGTFPKPPIKGE